MLMKKPSYTNFPIYEILEDLSSKAGIKIEYGKLPKNVFGKCFNDERKIIMSDTNVYCSNKDEDGKNNASFILAHEIAHAIINNLYFFNEYDYDHDIVTYKFIDADADKIGGALYNFALMIHERNEMAKFENNKNNEDPK